MLGADRALAPEGDGWRIDLPAATASVPSDPPGRYYIGGEPVLIVEDLP